MILPRSSPGISSLLALVAGSILILTLVCAFSPIARAEILQYLSPAVFREAVWNAHGKGALKLRRFLQPLSSSSATTGSGVSFRESGVPVRSDNRFGMYLTAPSIKRKNFFLQTLDRIVAEGGNAVVLEVKGSYVYFATSAPMANRIGTAIPAFDLPFVISAAKERGLYTIGRFIAVKDGLFVQKVPAAREVNPKTGKLLDPEWSDPAAPETLMYNQEILEDLFASGIDEVNFDYIRYSTAVRLSDTGLTGAEKADRILAFLLMAKEVRDRVNPQAKIGISTYAILGWDFKTNLEPLGQDFVRFAPLLDVISPMAYPATFSADAYYDPRKTTRSRSYYLVWRTLRGYSDLLGPDQATKVRPWLQAYGFTSRQIGDEIEAVYDSGLCGFTFWNAGNNYEPAYAAM